MIAPCGINCSVCIAYLREKNKCLGCLSQYNDNEPVHCTRCQIRNCDERESEKTYCFDCSRYPCQKLKKLDKRYKNSYHTSLISNLEDIKNIGIKEFVKKEKEKWKCKKCGNVISIHKNECLRCKTSYIKEPNYDNNRTNKVI
jgi:hypothetical protein